MDAEVILVDINDFELGTMGKMEAHIKGQLHRAFSIFIFNSKQELLIQQRASGKYHSAGLWTNTCCSHPQFGEETGNAAFRRLKEEMGMVCDLKQMFSFIYKAKFDNGLTEHEFDYVFFGTSDAIPQINKAEVQNWKYISMEDLSEQMEKHPEHYTEWLKNCFDSVYRYYRYYRIK